MRKAVHAARAAPLHFIGEGYAVQLPEPTNRLQVTESTGPRLQKED